MQASVIISGSPGSIKPIEDYQRISTLDQAEVYFSETRNIDSFQRRSACDLILKLFQTYLTLPPSEHLRVWRIKQLLVHKNPQLFEIHFNSFAELPLPEGFEKIPDLNPLLPPCPKLPPIPKGKIYQKIDSVDGFVIVEEDPEKELCEKHLKDTHLRELRYHKEVLTLFLHDYGSHIFSDPTIRYLWQTQLGISQEKWIEKIAEFFAFPDPSPFTKEQRTFVLGILKGLELFFRQFPVLTKRPQKINAADQSTHTVSFLENFITVLLEPHIKDPFRPFIASTAAHLLSEKLLNALEPEQFLLFINHITDIDFHSIVNDPSPPLEAFKTEDPLFSIKASDSIYNLLMSLLQLIPVNSVERKIVDQAKDWLKEHKNELGEILQLAIVRILRTPGRLNIAQALFILLWDVKDGKTKPVFPNLQKGKELSRAPELLEKKFVSFLHRIVKWQIDNAVSKKNVGIRILAEVGQAISDKPILSNLKKIGNLLFKLFNNKDLMLKLIEFTAQEIRLSKNQ